MYDILLYILLAVGGTALVWKGSDFLERSSEKLAAHYELPEIVQGAIIAAIGSSFPELSSTIISTMVHNEFDLGVGVIAGSAIFNILVIPGLSGLFSKHTLRSNRDLVYKEAQFYMVAVAALLLTFSFAVIYNPVSIEGSDSLFGTVDRKLALIPVALYFLYIFIQYQDTMDYTPPEPAEKINIWKQWGILILGLAIIVAGVEGLVTAAIGFGEIFNTPSFLWGITVIAAGTSISDSFVSIKAARKGKAITSMANVLGSNTFDLLICIPAGILIAGTATINFTQTAPLMGFLVLVTIILFVMIRTNLRISKVESVLLILLYILFIVWMILETIGVTHLVPME